MKKKLRRYKNYFAFVFYFFFLAILILSGRGKEKVLMSNVNKAKSIEALHIVEKYNSLKEMNAKKPIPIFETFEEAIQNAKEQPVAFMGSLTAYGPDCVGCGGGSACPPRQDFRNGNIYFEDQSYGTVRIVAADSKIPCGSILRISNVGDPFFAVVLDRGGAIKGNHLDLLFETEKNLGSFGSQKNIQFEIVRYGW